MRFARIDLPRLDKLSNGVKISDGVNILLESRVRENRLHGSIRGFRLIINLEIYYETIQIT